MKGSLISLGACIALFACSSSSATSLGGSSTTPASEIVRGTTTLRVVNPTSNSYEIRASPVLHPDVPQPASGVMDLGPAGPGTTCILLPSRFYEFVTRVPTDQTDTLTWVSSASMSIVAIGRGGAADVSGSTPNFVPDSASAWSVSLTSGGILAATADTRCTP